MSRIISLILGYIFLVLGILGLFLPFLQGFLFLAVGLILLARHAVWAQRTLEWIKRRHPKLASGIDRAEVWITRKTRQMRVWFGRKFGPVTR
jgi:uncharacterized membrane protein YbaN (DUF454 family)